MPNTQSYFEQVLVRDRDTLSVPQSVTVTDKVLVGEAAYGYGYAYAPMHVPSPRC